MKREIAAEIKKRIGIGQGQSLLIMDVVIDVICEHLARGELVRLNRFGKFWVEHGEIKFKPYANFQEK